MFLGTEFHSWAAALLKPHWPIVDLALIPSISELSLKLQSRSLVSFQLALAVNVVDDFVLKL